MTTAEFIRQCRELIIAWRDYDGGHGGDFSAAADDLERLLLEYDDDAISAFGPAPSGDER